MSTGLIFNARWVTEDIARAVPTTFSNADVSIGRLVDGRLIGGVLFKEFTHESIRMSVVGFEQGWLSRELLWAAFDYPFNQLGVQRVWSGMRADLLEVIQFNAHLGFKKVAEVPGIYPGNTSVVITQLERADCRWLRLKSRQYASNVRRAA